MVPDRADPYENTIFQTLSSAGAQPTVPLGAGSADGEIDPTRRVELDETGATRPLEADVEADVEPTVPLERNRRIGNYRLDSWVGKGGQGEVWLGENVLAGRKVALKFLHSSLAHDEQAMADLTGEAGVLFDLTHDRIVRLMNIERAGGHAFLVMEFLGGPSVQHVLQRRREEGQRGLSTEECLWILNEVAPGLDYANGEGVTHRDIKPANMMLTAPVDDGTPLDESEARVKLCDFGIAFSANKSMARKGEYDPIGTLPFMAPEVLMRQQPTPAADIYALGATLYYLVKGEPPIYGKLPPRELVERIKAEEPAPLRSGDAAFDAAIARALSKDPAGRQTSADELLREASGGRMGRVAQKARTLRTALWTAASVALVAAGAFFVWRGMLGAEIDRWSIEEGELVSARVLPVEIVLPDPAITEVEMGIAGGGYRRVGRSGADRFSAHLPTPERDGEAVVEVRHPGGERVYGTRSILVDKSLDVADVVERVEQGPYEVDAGVPLRFDFDEPVTLSRLVGGVERELHLERAGNRLEGRVDLTGVRDTAFDLAEDVEHELRFVARDEAGNEAVLAHVVPVYDEEAVCERYAARFDAEIPDAEWHDWDLGELLSRLSGWEAAVRSDDRRLSPELRRELLEGGDRGRVAARLRERHASLPAEACTIFAGAAREEERPSELRLHTSETTYTLQGRIEHARAGVATVVPAAGGEDGAPIALELDRRNNQFSLPLTLRPGEERVLTISATDMEPRVVRVVHDATPPGVEDLTFDPSVSADVAEIRLRPRDAHLASVSAEDARTGAVTELRESVEGGWWSASLPLPDEGPNAFVLVVADRAGNEARREVTVVRDTTGPSLVGEPPGDPARAGEPLSATFDFSEPVGGVTASFIVVEEDGSETVLAGGREIAADGDDPTRVRLTFPVPDRPADRVRIRIEPRDPLQNAGEPRDLDWPVDYDLWGAVPPAMREAAELVLEPGWAAGPGWTPYVVEEGGARYPRCIRHRATGVEFVYVPSGSFTLGARRSAAESAREERRVRMSGFYVARTEVTEAQYRRGGSEPTRPDGDARAVLVEGYSDAERWCLAQGLRLPSEAQWEYAASGPQDLTYPWGHRFDPQLVHAKLDALGPATRNDAGDLDAGRSWCHAVQMAGGVIELCRDVLDLASVPEGALDPEGVAGSDETFVQRGGSGSSRHEHMLATDFRSEDRGSSLGIATKGFRPVWEPR